jgi:RNA polymerase sigma-70 factor (ECF subfamily)
MDAIRRTGAGVASASQDVYPLATNSAPPTAEQIYHAYAPRVYNMARRMVRTDADAEDVTQDVLLKVVRELPRFRGESALPTWLHRVTLNTAISHRRKRAVRDQRRSRDPFDVVLADEPAPESRWGGDWAPETPLVRRETRNLIERAIADLPPIYRTVFVLADMEELPNAVISQQLGLSLPAIKSRLHRARQLLREALAPHFQEISA